MRPQRAVALCLSFLATETAKGVMFVSLEDEASSIQVIVWPDVREAQRKPLLHARLLGAAWKWQVEDGVRNLIAKHFVDMTPLLGRLATASRDFR